MIAGLGSGLSSGAAGPSAEPKRPAHQLAHLGAVGAQFGGVRVAHEGLGHGQAHAAAVTAARLAG
jgi:hypothetical protein